MHGKERAIGPALAAIGLQLEVPEGLDTDRLGTFTGEVPRLLPMRDCARQKARLAMERAGLAIGIGSEGSFGPHPEAGFIAAGRELLHFIDSARGIEISVERMSPRTNFASLALEPETDVEGFLDSIGFPSHAVIVRAQGFLDKGITSRAHLDAALARALALGGARIETDMRAHLNPTRMGEIASLAKSLAERLATPCPACAAPGFGPERQEAGLCCRACGTPTRLIKRIIHRCTACGHEQALPRPDRLTHADAQYCPECNP